MATDIFSKRPHSKARKDTILSKFMMGPNIITLAQGTQWKNQRIVSYYVSFITYYSILNSLHITDDDILSYIYIYIAIK